MAAVSANKAEITAAYDDVRNDSSETTWMLLNYEDGKDNLVVAEKGIGGINELASRFKDDQAQYGFLRYVYSNDPLSQRAKFVFICWCGPQTKIMRKAKLSVQMADVKSIVKSYAVEVQCSDKADLQEELIVKLIKKAGGANYDRQTSAY
eukprot:Partr_v1_DN23512_c0_g1_i2_m14455 putative Cofilin tropomyosin-type actin-binding protein